MVMAPMFLALLLERNNNYGVTGIAYDAKIMPVKVLSSSGSGSSSHVAYGIYYAVDNGANVINLSLGSNYSNDMLKLAIEYASSKGVIVVMAAGNDGDSSPDYPASYANESGIAVGAVDRNNKIADFSNRSGTDEITYVTAPGVDTYSSVPGNQYASYSGTSMASPHVAGVVALMLSANPNLTDAQVRQFVTETAENSTQATINGCGFNDSEVDSLTSQATFDDKPSGFAQTENYITPATISNFDSFNVSSLVSQAMSDDKLLPIYAQTENYITPVNNNTISQLESNDRLVNPASWLQFQDDDKIISNINTNITDGNNDSEDGNNPNFGNLIEIIQRRLEVYRKLLGLS